MEMSVIKLAIGTMDEKCEMANLRGIIKTSDTSKYNLRCNRNISEKMTKKDFIYDIRRPISGTRKLVEGQKRQIVLPIQLRRKTVPDSKMPQYTVITTKNDNGGGGDAGMMPERRDLGFECIARCVTGFCEKMRQWTSTLSIRIELGQELQSICEILKINYFSLFLS
ncbi:uncharacterized protein LOC107270592 isoform X2 [Cephus cinctus]|uniref:Uncharacterized protein LOC107270592 isoform X2 n=1 Tax=Cephus cinctus TaxID=211228 RepID=A0AAJ7RMJ6_CEPCN|nr:uncharacterized protein LOC107270592 isoform X2 [Cephus cinctus]